MKNSRTRRTTYATDTDLIAALLQDRPTSWVALLEVHGPAVRAAARKVARMAARHLPSDFAEDIEQSVFLKLLQNDRQALRAFDPSLGTLRTYLSRVSRNLALDGLASFVRCGVSVALDFVIAGEDADDDEGAPSSIDLTYWIGARRAAQKAARSTERAS